MANGINEQQYRVELKIDLTEVGRIFLKRINIKNKFFVNTIIIDGFINLISVEQVGYIDKQELILNSLKVDLRNGCFSQTNLDVLDISANYITKLNSSTFAGFKVFKVLRI